MSSSLSGPHAQHMQAYQYQAAHPNTNHHHHHHHHHPTAHLPSTPGLVRTTTPLVCAARNQPRPHAHPHHQAPVGYHQSPQMNAGYATGGNAYTNASAGGYCPVTRVHHCNIHSFVCTNPNFQFQVSANCIAPHHPYPNFVQNNPVSAPLMAAPAPSSAGLLAPPSHTQMFGQPQAVSIPQQIPTGPQAVASAPIAAHNRNLGVSAHPMPHPQLTPQPTAVLGPFSNTQHLQLPHHMAVHPSARTANTEVLGRGVYRGSSPGHVFGRIRGSRNSSSMAVNRRNATGWRGNPLPTGPPPPQTAPQQPQIVAQLAPTARSSTYPGILLHFLAMLSHPSLQPYNAVEPSIPTESPDPENYEALLHLAERLGEAKPRGLLKTAIDQLPSYRYSGEKGDSKQTTCVICMSDFECRQMLRVLPCVHEFHSKCVDKWLKSNRTCPICRGDASDYVKETPMAE